MTAPRPASQMLTVHEVAAILRVSPMTVYRAVHSEELAAYRVGKSFRIPQRALDDYLRAAKTREWERFA